MFVSFLCGYTVFCSEFSLILSSDIGLINEETSSKACICLQISRCMKVSYNV